MFVLFKKLFAAVLFLTCLATSASAMFIQPDWWDPTKPGVGTNRYAYSGNDPINLADPNGNTPFDPEADQDLGTCDGCGIAGYYKGSPRHSGTWQINYNNGDIVDGLAGGPVLDEFRMSHHERVASESMSRRTIGDIKNDPITAVIGIVISKVVERFSGGLISRKSADEVVDAVEEVVDSLPPGIGVGPFAPPGGGVPVSRVNKPATVAERRQVDAQGAITGCHQCGTTNPGTQSGSFITDHQPPTSLNPNEQPQQLLPHCTNCSSRQGGMLRWFGR